MSVYFVRRASDGLVKIGASEGISRRMAALRSAERCHLTLMRAIRGGFSAEREIHGIFAAQRVSGEWFKFHPEMLNVEASIYAISEDVARTMRRREGKIRHMAHVIKKWDQAGRSPWLIVSLADIRPELAA